MFLFSYSELFCSHTMERPRKRSWKFHFQNSAVQESSNQWGHQEIVYFLEHKVWDVFHKAPLKVTMGWTLVGFFPYFLCVFLSLLFQDAKAQCIPTAKYNLFMTWNHTHTEKLWDHEYMPESNRGKCSLFGTSIRERFIDLQNLVTYLWWYAILQLRHHKYLKHGVIYQPVEWAPPLGRLEYKILNSIRHIVRIWILLRHCVTCSIFKFNLAYDKWNANGIIEYWGKNWKFQKI
jgi:hypothetical protein